MAERIRGRTGGTLLRRGPVWHMCFMATMPDGTRREVRESAKTSDKDVALDRLALRVRQAENARDGIAGFETPANRNVKVAELLDDLLAAKRRAGLQGLDREEYRLDAGSPLREFFGDRRAREVNLALVGKYIDERLVAKKANATINRETALLKEAFTLALGSEKVLKVPTFPKKLKEAIREEEVSGLELSKVLEHLPPAIGEAARFSFKTGWRQGALRLLPWSAVNRKGRTVTKPGKVSKNGKPFIVPMDDDLAAIIERRWKARAGWGGRLSAYVFAKDNGEPYSRTQFGKLWRNGCREAGIVGKWFHDLRHSAVTNLDAAGVSTSVAMSITGHLTDSMFRRYVVKRTDGQLEALRKAQEIAEARAEAERQEAEAVGRFPGA